MNHDNAHCLDYTSECPTTCYRARLTKELQDNPSIIRFVSWTHLYGTEVVMKRKTAVIVIICSLVAISLDFAALIYGSPFVKTVAILLGVIILLDLIFIALMYGSD